MPTTRAYLALLLALGGVPHLGCSRNESSPAKAASSAGQVSGQPALPGLGEGDPKLMKRLVAALAAKGNGYEPRTHHKHPDGKPKFINRLILETSPYLLQHAHNPVNWYSWGNEAFERARRENKPILLSVGYSTCHWCHVMERESFEDLEIAEFINRHFVAIKVDREERPDIDDVYMSAVQRLSGRGGWPMTVLLTPARDPFFGGTYFPPRDGNRGATKGFLTILRELSKEYQDHREQVVKKATTLSRGIAEQSKSRPARSVPDASAIDRAVQSLAGSFDPDWGGFGRAPKFPRPVALELLLRYHRRTGDPQALHIVRVTLNAMADGGLYDQLGGGFHRYSTDAHWLVPHFEKMLYDNAQLVRVYLSAHQLADDPRYERVARETLLYVEREMTDARGAFHSATDADSKTREGHDEEGYFFTWTQPELQSILGREEAHLFSTYYGVTPRGNFEGRNILHRPRPVEAVAKDLKTSVPELERRLAGARKRLYAERLKRPHPLLDDKILSSWNGLMISAFARAALVLGDDHYPSVAARAASFILDQALDSNGRLLRSYRAGKAQHKGYLDDYAFMIEGLLDLFEATSSERWLERAQHLQSVLDEYYRDPVGGYFMTSSDAEKLLARDKPSYDGAEPSGNSVALLNLLRLADITGKQEYREQAEKGLVAFASELERGGTACPNMLSALDHLLDSPREVVIVQPKGVPADRLLSAFRQVYLPNRVFTLAEQGPDLEKKSRRVPLLEGKLALHGKPTAYVCERGHCELPTPDPAVFTRQLRVVAPLFEARVRRPLPRAEPR